MVVVVMTFTGVTVGLEVETTVGMVEGFKVGERVGVAETGRNDGVKERVPVGSKDGFLKGTPDGNEDDGTERTGCLEGGKLVREQGNVQPYPLAVNKQPFLLVV
jgi:hypothetical protein